MKDVEERGWYISIVNIGSVITHLVCYWMCGLLIHECIIFIGQDVLCFASYLGRMSAVQKSFPKWLKKGLVWGGLDGLVDGWHGWYSTSGCEIIFG